MTLSKNNTSTASPILKNHIFSEIKGCFGFGFMRFVQKCSDEDVKNLTPNEVYDIDYIKEMIDYFIQRGYNYFDTAHPYMNELSEEILCECLTKRYPREKFILANKLSGNYFSSEEDVEKIFHKQLKLCGVDYFDMYLMHAQGKKSFKKYKKYKAYEQCLKYKEEGKIRHFGISFHDTSDVLDSILSQYPQIEFVQIQLNFLDWEDPAIQSKKCLEVCNKHDKPVIVMEPLKGSRLFANPQLALRFASTQSGVFMTLSGMNELVQVQENCTVMCGGNYDNGKADISDATGLPKKLTKPELEQIEDIKKSIQRKDEIKCTACSYCTAGCPKHISIPQIFACYNKKHIYHDWNQDYYYRVVFTKKGRRASDCIACKKCEEACPQHLQISQLMKTVADEFESDLTTH